MIKKETIHKRFNLENFIKLAVSVFVVLYALFNFIGQPKKNAEEILNLKATMAEVHKEMRQQILDNSKEIRLQDKEVSKINTKLEAISSQIMDVKTDVRALTQILKE